MSSLNSATIFAFICGSIHVIAYVCKTACEHVEESDYGFALLSVFHVAMPQPEVGRHPFTRNILRIMTHDASTENKTLDVLSHLSLDCSVTVL